MNIAVTENQIWKDCLGFSNRIQPELYEIEDQVLNTPYAFDIKKIMNNFPVNGVFCVQDKPEVVIIRQAEENVQEIKKIYNALWNQGLASILVVVGADTIRIFSLFGKSHDADNSENLDDFLIRSLEIASEEIFEDFSYAVESGRYWKNNSEFFDPSSRIDQVLLKNLSVSHENLQEIEKLNSDESQAALIQTMFIAYLEDRDILTEDFFCKATNNRFRSLVEILKSKDTEIFKLFFKKLRNKFNGDLFVTPCSFDQLNYSDKLTPGSMEILLKFREGIEEMQTRQLRLFEYNFKYISVSLISEVYSRFLSLSPGTQSETGSFFTPVPLVDVTLRYVWNNLDAAKRSSGRFLDPACGSGLYLIRCFQILCDHHRMNSHTKELNWKTLVKIVKRIHGYDTDEKAVRLAIFSLYVAMMEFIPNTEIKDFMQSSNRFPKLWNRTLVPQNYFSETNNGMKFDVVFGNPPWKTHMDAENSAMKWCKEIEKHPPNNELSWAFVFKAQMTVKKNGIVAFVLPVGSFLYNHSLNSISERNLLIENNQVLQIINLSDFRNQLFSAAIHPAAVIIFRNRVPNKNTDMIEYMVPKMDMSYRFNHSITISGTDRMMLNQSEILNDPLIFSKRFWITGQEMSLFEYLDSMPKLKDFIGKGRGSFDWKIGRGFAHIIQDAERGNSVRKMKNSNFSNNKKIPDDRIRPVKLSTGNLVGWPESYVMDEKFAKYYKKSVILLKRAFSLSSSRLVAALHDMPVKISDNVFSITCPKSEANRAKLVTAILNSSLAYWWAFHNCASVGTFIPRLNQCELLNIPFPEPEDFYSDDLKINSKKTEKMIINMIDKINKEYSKNNYKKEIGKKLRDLDKMVYEYFGLSDDEVTQIEDTIKYKFPAINPSFRNLNVPKLWESPNFSERRSYARKLRDCLTQWLLDDKSVSIDLYGINKDFGIIRISICDKHKAKAYDESVKLKFTDALNELYSKKIHNKKMHQNINNQRIFDGDIIYIIKPMKFQYWMESEAIEDSTNIAMDVQEFVYQNDIEEF